MINIFVNGALGKMGSESIKAIDAENDMTLVGQADKDDNLASHLADTKPDVVVDFTHPDTIYDTITTILNSGHHAVVGTTGLTQDQLTKLDTVAKEKNRGCLIAPNFAIGAILMMHFASQAAKWFSRVEIIERHHDKKADAPSGTAIKTAELIHEKNPSLSISNLDETELIPGARGGKSGDIPIHSLRLPGYIANQDVILGDLGQTLTISHETISRECFMPGVLLGIRKIQDLTGVIYGLENILNL